MQMQLQRQRQQKLTKERSQAAAVAAKAKRIANDWKREDDVMVLHERTQLARSGKEAEIRAADDALQQASSSLQSDGETRLHLDNRALVEKYDQAIDGQYEHFGSSSWRATMKEGEDEFAFERRESARGRKEALRGFGWSKADEHDEDALRSIVQQQLQTGPGAVDHLQTPSSWRTERLSMEPGAWRNEPTMAEVERAKTAQMLAHARSVRDYDSRRDRVTSVLGNWGSVQERVAEARYGAWRTKVDSQHSPRASSWAAKSMHRVSPPVHHPVLKSPRGPSVRSRP